MNDIEKVCANQSGIELSEVPMALFLNVALVHGITAEVGAGTYFSDFPTYQELEELYLSS